ncbi:5'-deoxynucleotidase HDDC2-like [Acropora muricata]|uniref:5'-deoxynucleotidase HDDC2-like n=1 Tax=Acropora muricata TaxID=159855 RepID=UPI0034E58DDE
MSDLLKFMTLVGKLKSTKRTGWVYRGVSSPESVSDHMYRMAVLSFFSGGQHDINSAHCMKLALVHDMAECIVGDITPFDGVSKEEKHRREKQAMEHLASLVGDDVGEEFLSLWQEYEAQQTDDAKFVKELDRFEMILQAHEYEESEGKSGTGWLQDFFDSTKDKFHHPLVKDWVQKLNEQRGEAKK